MGCGDSKQVSAANVQEIPAIDLTKLDRFSRFEHSFPFYRMRVDIFEGKVKRFVNERSSVTLS